MTDGRHPDTGGNRIAGSERPPGVPPWVTVSGIVVVILLLVLLIAMLAGGDHGPGRHGADGPVEPHRDSAAVASAGSQYEGLTGW